MIDDVRELLAARPFRSFVLVVTGMNAESEVDDPRQITIPAHGDTIHYRSRHGDKAIIALRHVTSVVIRKESRS